MGLIKMAAAGAIGYALYKYANRDKEAESAFAGNYAKVRDAGPENMESAPGRWSKTDQAIDESFPASDPPANY